MAWQMESNSIDEMLVLSAELDLGAIKILVLGTGIYAQIYWYYLTHCCYL